MSGQMFISLKEKIPKWEESKLRWTDEREGVNQDGDDEKVSLLLEFDIINKYNSNLKEKENSNISYLSSSNREFYVTLLFPL